MKRDLVTHLQSREFLALVAILGVALGIRIGAGVWWQARLPVGQNFGFPDSQGYWALGETIAQGRPYQFGGADQRIFRTPGYPLLLAGLFWLAGDEPPVLWARVLSAALGTLAVGGVFWLGRILFDRPTALLAALLAAVYPGAIAMSTFVLSEAPFCPLMVVQLACWSAALKSKCIKHSLLLAALGGLAAGAATLMRPSWLLFIPFAALLMLAIGRGRMQRAMITGVMLASLVLTMLPWWVRNYHVSGRFVPTTLQVGASLYDGISPQADGSSDMRFVPRFREEQHLADARAEQPPESTYEYRLDRRMRDAALAWAGENPGQVVRLIGVKFVRMWYVWPNAAELQSWPLRLVVMIGYLPLMGCGLWGGWKFVRRGWAWGLCLLPAVYFTALHVIFVGSIRYRQPAVLVMTVLAAAAVCDWIAPRRQSSEPTETD